MEIAQPPNNAQLRRATYSSLSLSLLFSRSRQVNGSRRFSADRTEEENYGWKVFPLFMRAWWWKRNGVPSLTMRFFVEKKTEKRRFPYEGKFLRNDESRFCNIIFLPKGRLKKIRVEKGEVLGSFLFFFLGINLGFWSWKHVGRSLFLL